MEGGRLEGEGPLSLSDARAFIFDLDGTLATIPVDWEGVRASLRELTGGSDELRPIFPTIAPLVESSPEVGREIFRVIDGFEASALSGSRLYDGAVELLAKLSVSSKLVLVTMQGRTTATKLLEMYGLKQYFVGYFTREDSLDRAEQVEMALSLARSTKDEAIFVGDRLNDLNAAKKVGVRFVLIRTHGGDPEDEDVPVYHSIAEFAATISRAGDGR